MAQMRLLMVEHVPAYLATGPDLEWDNTEYHGDDITLKYAASLLQLHSALQRQAISLQTLYCGKNDIHL